MLAANKFYNKSVFVLVDVAFNNHGSKYTYTAHKKQGVKVGDWVIVPIGTINDNDAKLNFGHNQVVKVDKIRPIEELSKSKFKLKHVIDVINTDIHEKIVAARQKLTKK